MTRFNSIVTNRFSSHNTKVLSYDILKEEQRDRLVQVQVQQCTCIYRIKFVDGRVYIGQSKEIDKRILQHNFKFGKELISDVKVLKYQADTLDEIKYIQKYRNRLGKDRVVNIDKGSIVRDIKPETRTCWFYQTPTQKAIMAYREWKRLKDIGEKVGQGVIADDFGTSVALLGRVKKLESLSGSDIIEELFQGNKLNIGTQHQPILTDSLLSLINSFTKRKSEILANTKTTSISEDFTDEETKLVDSIIFKLEYEHSKRILKLLNKKLYLKLKNNEVLG